MKNLIIASTSTLYGGSYLDYLTNVLIEHFKEATTILFIPYARPSGITYDEYTKKASTFFNKIGKKVVGIHEFEDPKKAIENAEGIFTGGGNTFLLVSTLYKNSIVETLAQQLQKGTPYLGTSAGSNITGLTMGTTNDMPIVYPPSFKTLSVIPFNINPHYIDTDTALNHMGETRETRIAEFHKFNPQPVIGLREGSWLQVKDTTIILKGELPARWFTANANPIEIFPETKINELL
ncbi:dipeptidase PepE [Flavobacterium sp.]|uniref:dipeptidase PepE n=1 Tax=Flavobacterium sp. TaxID=239 RepID=UPI00352988DE